MSNALDTTFEISKLLKFSPKHEHIFEDIKRELAPDSPGFRVLCPTRWTIRGESLHSVIANYCVLQKLWDACLETRLQPDIRSRIIGVQEQMKTFEYVLVWFWGERILKHADNLSKTLQHKNISATEAQSITSLTVKTLQLMRNDNSYENCPSIKLHNVMLQNQSCQGEEKCLNAMSREQQKQNFHHLPRVIIKEFTLRHLIWLLIVLPIGLINLGTFSIKTWRNCLC